LEAVVKVGGSLGSDPRGLRSLMGVLARAARAHSILVVPGGWRFADTVREASRIFRLGDAAAHRMAILAMDQYGLLLRELAPECRGVQSLVEAEALAESGTLPILLPSELMLRLDPFKPSWSATSDSIAAFIAALVGASKLVLAKDVDGVFTAHPGTKGARLIKQISVRRLLGGEGRGCLDGYMPRILSKIPLETYVVNGKHPARLMMILSGRATVCTRIKASRPRTLQPFFGGRRRGHS